MDEVSRRASSQLADHLVCGWPPIRLGCERPCALHLWFARGLMGAADHYRMLAYYNRVANERLYDKVADLDDAEYRKPRQGSSGSIHALLNHVLLGDRIWMARFQGGGQTTPRLN